MPALYTYTLIHCLIFLLIFFKIVIPQKSISFIHFVKLLIWNSLDLPDEIQIFQVFPILFNKLLIKHKRNKMYFSVFPTLRMSGLEKLGAHRLNKIGSTTHVNYVEEINNEDYAVAENNTFRFPHLSVLLKYCRLHEQHFGG